MFREPKQISRYNDGLRTGITGFDSGQFKILLFAIASKAALVLTQSVGTRVFITKGDKAGA
jgi:hypothetical protein